LALHTLPQIANFDRAYNELILRLRHKEEEIGLWMVKELDENRFKVMGEISGLVIHDLATPFQVVYFCVHEVLRKNPARLADKNFCDHLLKNIEHAKNLLFSYDGFLRNPKDPAHTGATIALAHQQAKDILNSQFFRHSLMQEIRFTLDPELADIPLAIGPADLLHVIYNLYKNSIEYLIQHPMEDPFIEVSLLAVNEKEIVFVVADSGVGISPAKFSDLVNAPLRLKNQAVFGKSVGLRLVYSLVQRHKGDLQVHNMGAGKTCMRVRLLTRAQEEESRSPHLIFEPEAVMG
jgi:signal transduction histidine kinase